MNKEDYSKYYIQGTDHYLIPKDVFIELFNEMSNWKEESKELNKKYLNAVADYETTMSDKKELKKQLETLEETNNQLISKLDRYDAIVDERDELKKQLRISAIFNEEDIRLDQTKEVFETLENILNTESCSYRYLIYDLLGFKEENYIDLIAGMSITNAIVEFEELKNQQKEFIEYMTKTIEELECDDVDDEEMKGYLIQRIDTFKEILLKFKEIIGGK